LATPDFRQKQPKNLLVSAKMNQHWHPYGGVKEKFDDLPENRRRQPT
jgi:hypothetical protein